MHDRDALVERMRGQVREQKAQEEARKLAQEAQEAADFKRGQELGREWAFTEATWDQLKTIHLHHTSDRNPQRFVILDAYAKEIKGIDVKSHAMRDGAIQAVVEVFASIRDELKDEL